MNKEARMAAFGGTAAGAFAAGLKAVENMSKLKNIDGRGQTVLITGGSGGIGRALADLFAGCGFDLVLAARNEEALLKARQELEEEYKVKAEIISVDLSDPEGARRLYDEIHSRGIVLDQFVNNAGAGKAGKLIDVSEEDLKNLINLNVTSFTILARLISADMVKRGKGKILNVSSMSAFVPDPGLNIYGPTKAYERFLTETMYGELCGTGVTVSALCPGPVKTNWSKNAGRKDSRISLNVKDVAREAFDGMQMGKLIIVPSLRFKAAKTAGQMMPSPLLAKILGEFQSRLKD